MKLEKGMYVRTKYGIAKYLHEKITSQITYYVIDKDIVFCNVEGWENILIKTEIIKASHNIIDLIEAGDIVTTKHLGLEKEYIEVINNETSLEILKSYFKEKSLELISIVTKQQFESMQYEVK